MREELMSIFFLRIKPEGTIDDQRVLQCPANQCDSLGCQNRRNGDLDIQVPSAVRIPKQDHTGSRNDTRAQRPFIFVGSIVLGHTGFPVTST